MINKTFTPVIIIAAGSFSGKSIIANYIANKYCFSGVLSTDMVRNFFHVTTKNEEIFSTSTYKMPVSALNTQKEKVSQTILGIIDIYLKRGEKIIIEGMHFSESFLASLTEKDFLLIGLDNKLSVKEKVVLKRNTTRMGISMKTEDEEHRIEEISTELLNCCRNNGFNIIEFDDIEEAKRACENLVEEYLRGLEEKRAGIVH